MLVCVCVCVRVCMYMYIVQMCVCVCVCSTVPSHPPRLDHKGSVRVGDFGLAEDMYSVGYVREEKKTLKIPYKWLPLESLEDGVFSEMSDVVRLSVFVCVGG